MWFCVKQSLCFCTVSSGHASIPACWLSFLPLVLTPPSLYACLQDRRVISSSAYQPSLGNCLQVLSLQQGSLRPLCVLPAATPVQEDMYRHHQQAAEAQLLGRVRTWTWLSGQQHTDSRVTGRKHTDRIWPEGWPGSCLVNMNLIYFIWRRGQILVVLVHVCLNFVWLVENNGGGGVTVDKDKPLHRSTIGVPRAADQCSELAVRTADFPSTWRDRCAHTGRTASS